MKSFNKKKFFFSFVFFITFNFSDNPFKFLINLMESSTLAYKEQFTKSIFDGVLLNNRLEIALFEIKVYSFLCF